MWERDRTQRAFLLIGVQYEQPEDLIKSLHLDSVGVGIGAEILHFQQAHR